MKKVIRNIIIVLICLVALVAILDYAGTVYAYNENIVHRYESYEPRMLKVSDFTGLNCTEYTFENNHGEKLAGYLYSYDLEPKGIIIFAHGLGAGQNGYMGYADYFAQNGYYVFAYDVTGCDASEGDSIRGVPQAVVDLDRAISFVENSGNFPDLPIGLWGHSWGAYSVSTVLNYHPEVKAVIECAGCNASSDIFQLGAEQMAGEYADVMMPCVKIHEALHYGKYASRTAMDGFDNTDAAIMCVHSDSDEVVAAKFGYDKYISAGRYNRRIVELITLGHVRACIRVNAA